MTEANFNKTHQNIIALRKLGISVSPGKFTVDTNGLAWLINFVRNNEYGMRLTPARFKEVGRWSGESEAAKARELRLIVTKFATYDSGYYRVSAYLNLTPPDETVIDFPLVTEIRGTVEMRGGCSQPGACSIKLDGLDRLVLILSDSELQHLLDDGKLKVAPVVREVVIL